MADPRRVLVGIKNAQGTRMFTADPELCRQVERHPDRADIDHIHLELDRQGRIMGTYSFTTHSFDKDSSPAADTASTLASCAGPAKVVAEAMRQVADMLDPPTPQRMSVRKMPWWRRLFGRF